MEKGRRKIRGANLYKKEKGKILKIVLFLVDSVVEILFVFLLFLVVLVACILFFFLSYNLSFINSHLSIKAGDRCI